MRYLSLLLLPSFAFADISIDHPTAYNTGQPLSESDISHYKVCVIGADPGCLAEFSVVGDSMSSDLIPANAHKIKAATVLNDGRESEWSNTLDLSRPLPPKLSIKITVEIN